jgi:hypothetical protein
MDWPGAVAGREATDMDRDEALRLLRGGPEGVKEWNRRRKVGEIIPDLFKANLLESHLIRADLFEAQLSRADLSMASLSMANLSQANLTGADFIEADLSGSDLSGADFSGAKLGGAKLNGANLGGTYLGGAYLNAADLTGADLNRALCNATVFANVDLSTAKGLESVQHQGPSHLSTDTIIRSQGKIPESFLRGCGLPDAWIANLPDLIGSMSPIQFYSCFISYSSKDTLFAERLHADLQAKGVRCWFAPEDLKIGEKIRHGIDRAIQVNEKLLLVLSKHSVESEWVEKEVETAMEKERSQKRTVLFPVRLDEAVMKVELGWPADVRRTRNIGDFRKWKQPETYQKAMERLLRDLRADEPVGKA